MRKTTLCILKVLGLAAAYYAAGRLAILLAIPPGYASAVWPAAGIALAGILLWGYRVWPGLVLGSFCVNVFISFDASNAETTIRSAAIAASIGFGAAMQGLFGAWMIRRRVGFPTPLTEGTEIVQFLLLGGPFACLVGASCGVTTLLAAGVIPPANYFFSWWTWWVGDTIGVLIFTPLVLIFFAQPQETWRRRRASVALPLGIAFSVVVVAFVAARSWERERMQFEFERETNRLAQSTQQSFESSLESLYAVQGFLESLPDATREQFQPFATRLYRRQPNMQAIEWIPRVTGEYREAYETAARREGLEGFTFTERDAQGRMRRAGERDEYFPVYFVHPPQGNESALGFDLASNPTRLATLQAARDTGLPMATPRINLVQAPSRQFGFLVVAPVYKASVATDTQDARRKNLQGFALGVFRIRDTLLATLKDAFPQGITMQLVDESAKDDGFLFGMISGGQVLTESPPRPLEGISALARSVTFDMCGRNWSLKFAARQEFLAAGRSFAVWLVLAGGLALACLLGAFLLILTGRTVTVQQLVALRTEELATANRDLAMEVAVRKQTEQHQARHAQILARLNEDLKRSNQDLDDFAYIASHDLREPLRGIFNYASFLAEDYSDKIDVQGRAKLHTLTRLCSRLDSLIDSLLDVSRAGRVDYAIRETDLNQVLNDVVDSLHVSFQEHGVQLLVPEPLPRLHCDRVRIGHVFRNLLTNAIKYNDKPDRWIEVGWRREVQSEDRGNANVPAQCVLYVRDNGIGIREKHLPSIFRIFKRLHGRDCFGGGTGAGLTIVKKIVERHRGTISVKSELDVGSTFYVTLPGAHSVEPLADELRATTVMAESSYTTTPP